MRFEIDEKIFYDPKFKKAFWNWFDNLTTEERARFQNFPIDTSEIYFYNKIYNKGVKITIK